MLLRLFCALAFTVSAVSPVFAATAKSDPSADEIDKIIRQFAANEAAFAKARENYRPLMLIVPPVMGLCTQFLKCS